jgi:hypothetical protein
MAAFLASAVRSANQFQVGNNLGGQDASPSSAEEDDDLVAFL